MTIFQHRQKQTDDMALTFLWVHFQTVPPQLYVTASVWQQVMFLTQWRMLSWAVEIASPVQQQKTNVKNCVLSCV